MTVHADIESRKIDLKNDWHKKHAVLHDPTSYVLLVVPDSTGILERLLHCCVQLAVALAGM
jgi:hypothetical protein